MGSTDLRKISPLFLFLSNLAYRMGPRVSGFPQDKKVVGSTVRLDIGTGIVCLGSCCNAWWWVWWLEERRGRKGKEGGGKCWMVGRNGNLLDINLCPSKTELGIYRYTNPHISSSTSLYPFPPCPITPYAELRPPLPGTQGKCFKSIGELTLQMNTPMLFLPPVDGI